jgi:hypothetical protein
MFIYHKLEVIAKQLDTAMMYRWLISAWPYASHFASPTTTTIMRVASWLQVVLTNDSSWAQESRGSSKRRVQTGNDAFIDRQYWDTLSFNSVWSDERIIPAYVAAASLIFLATHAIVTSSVAQKWLSTGFPKQTSPDIEPRTSWLQKRGGPTIIAFKTIRLLAISVLLGLALFVSVTCGWQWYNYVLILSLVSTAALLC